MILKIENIKAIKKVWNDIEHLNSTGLWPTSPLVGGTKPNWVQDLEKQWKQAMLPMNVLDNSMIIETAYRGIIEYFLERHQ